MKFLIIYATVGGHTRKIVDFLTRRMAEGGSEIRLVEAGARVPDLKFADYDGVVIAGPVYQQRHPDELINLVKAHAADASSMPSALVSVSLTAAFPDGAEEAQSYVDRLLNVTGWKPTAVHCAAGALRFDKYDFFQEQIIRHVVLKGRAPDLIEGEQEFTDWDALTAFIDAFIARAGTA